jgi:hypothetical protein
MGGVSSKRTHAVNTNINKISNEPTQSTSYVTFKEVKDEKHIGKQIQNSHLYNNMDDNNKKAIDTLSNKGTNAMIQHMFTDQETGKPLSYAEMRSRYG